MGRNKRLSAKKRQREREQREKREIKAEQRARRRALRKAGIDPDSPEAESFVVGSEDAEEEAADKPDINGLPWPSPENKA